MEKNEILDGLNEICESMENFNSKCRKYGVGHNYYKELLKKIKDKIKLFLITLERKSKYKTEILQKICTRLGGYLKKDSPQVREGKELINFIGDNLIELEFELDDYNINLAENGGIIVKHISGNHGWTDRNKKFSDFLKGLKGQIRIVDSYYGLGSFHVLDNFGDKDVKFLTAQLGSDENQDKVSKELQRFKREFPKIQLKKYSKFWELHDRYILSEDMLVWIGHGIKDFGDKECFLIGIPINNVSAISKNLKAEFEERWKKADSLV